MSFVGLCHDCKSSGVKTELDKNGLPICVSCREELAATKRQQENKKIVN